MKTATRLLAVVLVLAAWYACDRPTPVAPTDSVLTITGNPTRIGVNDAAIITVLARKADGTAVNPGTEINFSTTLGTIDGVVMTDDRGIAEATLQGDGRIGMATVTADSGAAGTATIEIQIGALASSITLSTNKTGVNKDLPPGGERIKLTAQVFDDLSNPIRGVAVRFESDTGTFEEGGSVETNLNGKAKNVLVVKEVRNVTDGFFEITVLTAADGGTDISDVLEISVDGFAANITLTVTPTSIPVTGGIVSLAALVRDDFGDAAVGEEVNFITDLGTLASGGGLIPTDAGGQAFDTLTVTEDDLASLAPGSGITVSAIVPGTGGELIESAPSLILLQSAIPIAGFDFTVTGLTVNFINTTTGDAPLTFAWDFGDGGTSTSENPGNTYAAEGTFTVTLTATNVGGEDTISKDVIVAATPDITVSPTSISFGSVANPGTSDRIVTISNAGGADLTITGFASSNPVFSVISPIPPPLGPGDSANITLRFTPVVVLANTAESGSLTVTSDDPNETTVTVSLSGTATP